MPAIIENTKRKLSLLQLVEELGNVSQACRIMGYHLKGRTPAQALRDALGRKKLPPVVPMEQKETEKQAA